MKSILAGRGVLTPPILWRPPPHPTRTLFRILSTPSPVPCYLQPLPPLLFLLSCFFRWVGDRAQGRIQAVFDIGNCFWAHKNRCPNFDRSTKVMILMLFNSRYIDLNNVDLLHLPPTWTKYCKLILQLLIQYWTLSLFCFNDFLHFNIPWMIDVFLFYSFLHYGQTSKKVLQPLSWWILSEFMYVLPGKNVKCLLSVSFMA